MSLHRGRLTVKERDTDEREGVSEWARQWESETEREKKQTDKERETDRVRLRESLQSTSTVTWPKTMVNGRKLDAAHNKWLRRTLHISWMSKITNKEIWERTGQEDMGNIIRRRRRMHWMDVARMEGERWAVQAMDWSQERKRKQADRERTGRKLYMKTSDAWIWRGVRWSIWQRTERDQGRDCVVWCAEMNGKD